MVRNILEEIKRLPKMVAGFVRHVGARLDYL
jgi:hypothetical protein